MNALTLRQPWAHAVAQLGKTIENRRWPPPSAALGHDLAIHTAKSPRHRQELADWLVMRTAFPDLSLDPEPPELARGAVVAVARLAGTCFETKPGGRLTYSWIGDRQDDGGGPNFDDQWFVGPWGWILENVRRLDSPVPCRGRQGLWHLNPTTERLVLAQLGGTAA